MKGLRYVGMGLALMVLAPGVMAQAVDDVARQQGYALEGDVTRFVFDAALNGVTPSRVVVTGAFRNWSQDMNASAWHLQPHPDHPDLWHLAVDNAAYQTVGAGTPFKFRIDDGQWIDPPASAPNRDGGNLVFLFGVAPLQLKAELRGPTAVWATITGDGAERPLDASAYRLTDGQGTDIPIARVLPNTASQTLLVPAHPLDARRVYYLELPGEGLRSLCRRDPWFRTLYSDKPLGAEIDAEGNTTFRLFAPRADRVQLYLYFLADDTPDEAARVVEMRRDADGVWETTEIGDHHGVYYDFRIHGPADPGNFFYPAYQGHITDPYARVSVDSFGKGRVWKPTVPATPLNGGRPAMEDVVAYEVHVQDFTDLLPINTTERGALNNMVRSGLRNKRGEPIGMDYLVDLGINVVHLMPIQEFLHYPDDEWRAAFADDPYMRAQGVAEENYQWGYRTTHAFAVETRFRAFGTEHGAQRDQFRDLVQAFHDAGLAVIIDVVPNHTGENMDGRDYRFTFNGIDRPYYYRTDDALNHIGPFGNEVKTEERPMVQRWVLDQLRHFVNEFGIDGYRIDLAGQIDEQTLRWVKAQLPDDLIIYGEAWIPPTDPEVAGHPDWGWYKADAPITFFQDDARNAFGSPIMVPTNKKTDRGYAGGNASLRGDVMKGLMNSFAEEVHPNRGINYLDIHDDWALADRYATTDWDGRKGVDEGPYKVAATLLLTSLGPIVLHGGTEIMRSKGVAPLQEIVKVTASGELHYHGKRDTYNLRKANQFVWENVGATPVDGSGIDYAAMHAYWKGLIALRMSDLGAAFRLGEVPPEDYYQWILPDDEHLLGYIVDGRILVLVNTDEDAHTFGVTLPDGNWRLIADGKVIDHENGIDGDDPALTGGSPLALSVPATTAKIWVRE